MKLQSLFLKSKINRNIPDTVGVTSGISQLIVFVHTGYVSENAV